MNSEFLTTGEAARLLNLSEASVRAGADRGVIPCRRTEKGRRIFVRTEIEVFSTTRGLIDAR